MKTSPNPLFTRLVENLERVVQGKTRPLQFLVVSLLSGGHVLMEDVPGVGKTTLAKALAASIRGSFRRVQFTPDLLPTDILGSSIYNPREGTFDFHQGPVFCNILLADEINRASPRTQSSLLEAMSEGQATIEGVTRTLPRPFVVLATQNPIEFHGTYPLPEAQLDRFTMRLALGYPDRDHELAVLEDQRQQHPLERLESVTDLDEVMQAQEAVRQVRVERPISEYILALVQATREDPRLKLGSSTRGALALYRTAQARAWCEGRDYVLPDDIKALSTEVLAHRVMLDTKSRYSGVSREDLVAEIVGRIPPTP
jgi:MoxR-like ATPase